MKTKYFRIHGISPEGTDHEWSGTGWGDMGRGKLLSEWDAHCTEIDMNLHSDFICWKVQEGERVEL